MRKKKLAKNTISSLIFQVTTIVCGFILPRLILLYYGSETNGLVNSITQFLSVISFLELGVGAVVQSSLYKPLSKNDSVEVSKIVKSANKFFRTLAKIMLVYVGGLILFFPFISNQSYNFAYTATLILAMSISSFAQYYFGIVNRLLLLADQKGYIQYNVQTVTLIANTAACAVIISQGASIQFVKLTTSLIYLIRPVLLQIYVDRNYQIDKNRVQRRTDKTKVEWCCTACSSGCIGWYGYDCSYSILVTLKCFHLFGLPFGDLWCKTVVYINDKWNPIAYGRTMG